MPTTMHTLGHARNRIHVNRNSVNLCRTPQPVIPVSTVASPQQLTFNLQATAMLVIDMQNDFCSAGGWLDHIGVDFAAARTPIEPLNRLLPQLRNHDVPIIWLNWGNRPDRLNLSPTLLHIYNHTGEDVGLGDPLPGNHSPVLERESWGAAIVDELNVEPTDIQIDKYRMSGFWDTPLDSILRNLRIDTLLFAGVNLDQCVLATLQDAACLGYDCILIEDCAATTSPDFCREAALYNINQVFGYITASQALECGIVAVKGAPS